MSNETIDKDRLISIADAADLYGFSRIYLSELAKKGKLKAQRIGRSWVTTPGYVEEFIQNRQKKGAYREDIQVPD